MYEVNGLKKDRQENCRLAYLSAIWGKKEGVQYTKVFSKVNLAGFLWQSSCY